VDVNGQVFYKLSSIRSSGAWRIPWPALRVSLTVVVVFQRRAQGEPMVIYGLSPPILHRIFLPHAHFLFPTHHSKSRGNSVSNAQFQVVLQIRLIHFPRNSCRFLLELKCSVVIDKFSKPHERKRVFFLSFCHKRVRYLSAVTPNLKVRWVVLLQLVICLCTCCLKEGIAKFTSQ